MADRIAADTNEVERRLDELNRKARHAKEEAKDADSYEGFARAGYAAKGVVYCLIGVLAMLAAFRPGAGGQTTDSGGALRVLDQGPAGDVILALMALGLIGYVLWRMVQAFIDPENVGDEDWGWVTRAMYAVSGIAYAFLAIQAVQMVLGGGGGGGGSETQTLTAKLLAQPFGPWLVGAVGVAIGVRGIMQAKKAWNEDFFEKIRHSGEISRETVRKIGKVGLTARGIVFMMIAGFLVWAAIEHNAHRARGLEGALDTLAGATGGPWLLGAAGLGLLAYGLFQFIKARYRVIGRG